MRIKMMTLLTMAMIAGVLAWKVPPALRAQRESAMAQREHEGVVAHAEMLADLRSREQAVFPSRRATGDLVAQLGDATRGAGQVRIASFDPMGQARVALPALAQTDLEVMRQSVRVRVHAADLSSLGRFFKVWHERRTRWEPSAITLTFTKAQVATGHGSAHEQAGIEADMVLATTFVESRSHGTR